jgi:hypothetical protein
VTLEQLKEMLASGQVMPSDQVWRDGMTNWAAAGSMPELGGQPLPPPTPVTYVPPTPAVPMSQRPEPWSHSEKTMRIMLIVAAGVAMVTFFTPQFYRIFGIQVQTVMGQRIEIDLSQTGLSKLVWGWDTWFGITTFILSWFALGGAIVDLCLRKIKLVPVILQWVHLGLFSLMGLMTLVGTILGIFGVGLAASYCIPITSILGLLGMAMGVTVSIMLVVKYRSRT